MQNDVDFGYQLSICSKTDGHRGNTLVKMARRRSLRMHADFYSQQSGVQIQEP